MPIACSKCRRSRKGTVSGGMGSEGGVVSDEEEGEMSSESSEDVVAASVGSGAEGAAGSCSRSHSVSAKMDSRIAKRAACWQISDKSAPEKPFVCLARKRKSTEGA